MTYEILLSADGASPQQHTAARQVFRQTLNDKLGRPERLKPYYLAWAGHLRNEPQNDEQWRLARDFLLAKAAAEKEGQRELGAVVGTFDIRLTSPD